MKTKTFKRGVLASSIAVILASTSSLALAAEEAAATLTDKDVETIQVTGMAGSNRASVNAKRFSDAIVDGVSSEDVGQFPDSDVAQALARIPGVTVGREFGQGNSVSIRGTDPVMTLTTLNGQNVSATGWWDQGNLDRSFNYSMLPSDLIGGIDVYKTTQANLVEGGIGGTVIVKTLKPLDLDAHRSYISVKGEYGSISETANPEVSGLYSWKNDDETFGILVSGAYIDREYLRRGTESDLDWGGRSSIQPSGFQQNQERTALDATIQYRPTDNLEFSFHALSLDLGGDSIGANMYIQTDTNWVGSPADGTAGPGNTTNPSACEQFNDAGVCVISNTLASAPTDVFFQNWARKGEMSSDTFELSGTYTGDDFSVTGIVGNTSAKGGTQMSANFGYGWWGDNFGQVKWDGQVDATGKEIKIDGADMSFTVDQLDTTVGTSQWTGVQGPNSDEESYVQFDFDFNLDMGILTNFEAGVRYTDHKFEREQYNAVYDTSLPNEFNSVDLYSGTMQIGEAGYTVPKGNLDAMINGTLSLVDEFVYSRPGYGLIEEENFSLYGMFKFSGDKYRGNFGVRYIKTDVTSSGHDIDGSPADALATNAGWSQNIVSETGGYDDFLPSFNIAYDLSHNVMLRFAAGQAITRPGYDNLFLSSLSGFPDDRSGNEDITYGNPDLKPMKSTQFDLGIEYYYGDGNLLAATIFTKSIEDFIVGTEPQIGVPIGTINTDLVPPADSWNTSSYENAGGGKINGIELQLNQAWDNGFGVNVNYTYANDDAPSEVYTDGIARFTQASEHMTNLVGYWENDEFSARAAYNWRSEYMVREYGKYYGNRMHDDFGTLDLTLGWNATESLLFSFEVVNALGEDDIQYGAAAVGTEVKPALQDGYPTWSFNGETVYSLGATYSF
ncbi:TonB-dependent receptor [Colwellia echini]|uniref:TonB-dependent receptor n=1 Tax=Colwellia echini TaxID=1982103 RepID=A0ABY3MXW4_9GAMM|nr:TonB-dependent receptor [Colwellia echini]TYK65877.1 TonB-dependent receptor [Colwellia echini]